MGVSPQSQMSQLRRCFFSRLHIDARPGVMQIFTGLTQMFTNLGYLALRTVESRFS